MSRKVRPRRPSVLAKQVLGLYTALIVYASWYPFSGWRSLGLSPLAYLADPLPQYLTVFDVVTNVLGYMPFGALAMLAVYPRWRGAAAVALAFGLGVGLSGTMEAVQTYLPTRVASNLDLAANALGALLGAALIAPATGALLDRGLLRRMRLLWFRRDSAALVCLAALWPFATMFPSPRLFGLGDWPRALWLHADSTMQDPLLAWFPAAWHVQTWPSHLLAALPDDAWEALIATLMLFAAGALASLPMRSRAPRVRLLLVLVALTVFVKIGATFLQSVAGLVFDWATPGALAGLAGGTLVMLLALRLPRRWRAALAAAALVIALLLVNLLPVNPYFDVTLADWRQGRYLHFNGLAHWLAWIWPYAALGWLAFSAERAWLRRRASAVAPPG
ncbi:VanZ family protein [Paraburkholderia sp. BCC1885]|uniref:VanZ family protein n=1 Tax=Paraburkholderia sp. BCC1885 TaxID=2562669 RepID=UPI001182D502|nr:VanZ family protein [Paraburkholderia sp. BCC1885]